MNAVADFADRAENILDGLARGVPVWPAVHAMVANRTSLPEDSETVLNQLVLLCHLSRSHDELAKRRYAELTASVREWIDSVSRSR